MKATIKATGEVIEVEWSNARFRWIQIIPNRRNKPLQNCDIEIYQDEPTDVSNIIDWEQRRYEIARGFFLTGKGSTTTAIANADLLIQELNEICVSLADMETSISTIKIQIKMKEIVIYEFQLKVILDALRLTNNINHCNEGKTCYDRQVRQAYKYAENVLEGKKDEYVKYQ